MYHLLPNEEQHQILETVRNFLAGELPIERWRPRPAQRPEEITLWSAMAELGWFGLGVEETAGGVGYGLAEEVLLVRECGRFLVSPAVMATMLAAHTALAAQQPALARALVAGERRAVPALSARIDGAIAGARDALHELYVFDHRETDWLLVPAPGAEAGLWLVGPEALAQREAQPCLDETLALYAVTVQPEQALCHAADRDGALRARLQVMLAAMLVGLAEAARDSAVDYAKVREQFGKPIGSFQAVKHKCADMAMRTELGWAQTALASLAVQHARPEAVLQAATAKWLATDAAQRNGDAAIQVYGGIGFQAECPAHHFVKRSHVYDQLGGSMAELGRVILEQPSPF